MPNQTPNIAQELLSHQAFLRRLAIDLGGEDADDLVQEVWRRALQRPPHRFDGGRQLRGWLARVMRNLAANRWRDEARRRSREERSAKEQPAEDELRARYELRKELVAALDSLSESSRDTILLRYYEGLAPRDIATRQGIAVATVKKRLQRGLAQLREALDERHGGDRATWMSAVTALAVPVAPIAPGDSGIGTSTLVIGGMAMGTMMKVSAAVLVVVACVYFVARTPPAEPPRVATVESPVADVELPEPDETAVASPAEDPATKVGRRSAVENEPDVGASGVTRSTVLRVVIEGVSEEEARTATVRLYAVDERERRIAEPVDLRDSWPALGSTSEFDLDPFFAVLERDGNQRVVELDVEVDHPLHFLESTRIPLSSGVEDSGGRTVFEVSVPLVPPVYWPELTLAVRDAVTREHLEDVELRSRTTNWMGLGKVPGKSGAFTVLGGGLSSPIVMLGGHKADVPEKWVAGIALLPPAGEAPRPADLSQAGRVRPERGTIVYARAPGYAWGSISLDVSSGGERELLLGPAGALDIRFTNVQFERYAELETVPTVSVVMPAPGGGFTGVWSQRFDEILETEGLRLEGLDPGDYAVSVALGGLWDHGPVLAREEISLAVGETPELVLELADPPAPPKRATIGGVISFPAPTPEWGEEKVRLKLNTDTQQLGRVHVDLSLADLERVAGGALPTWSFRVEDLPVGLYQFQLEPFEAWWMIELPAEGVEDVELVMPELAEVFVETVDARTGERIPIDEIGFRTSETLPDHASHDWVWAEIDGEPGRFRFWTAPGAGTLATFNSSVGLEYGWRRKELELVPGFQSVRFEFTPVNAIRFEFRDGEATLPHEDGLYYAFFKGIVHPVDHEGQVGPLYRGYVRVSEPGIYEADFDGVGGDRFHPIPPQRVEVREGEMTEVIIQLHRK